MHFDIRRFLKNNIHGKFVRHFREGIIKYDGISSTYISILGIKLGNIILNQVRNC